jgi:putative acyl-CoA dehydrogenase
MECLGGNGYVDDSIMPRLYRESPVNAIWEGSGNVIALDVVRALAKSPQVADAFLAEIDLAAGADAKLDHAATRI